MVNDLLSAMQVLPACRNKTGRPLSAVLSLPVHVTRSEGTNAPRFTVLVPLTLQAEEKAKIAAVEEGRLNRHRIAELETQLGMLKVLCQTRLLPV